MLLDRTDSLGFNDWRQFAEMLGCSKLYINGLKNSRKIESPTDELIEWWEMSKSDEIPLQRLVEIFKDMERYDVVEVLEKIPGVPKAIDEQGIKK
jgi:nicotinamide mononucleotide adenylyltransferase